MFVTFLQFEGKFSTASPQLKGSHISMTYWENEKKPVLPSSCKQDISVITPV